MLALRERPGDELLPWDFIETGVSKEFLWREYRRWYANFRAEEALRNEFRESSAAPGSYEQLRSIYDNYRMDRLAALYGIELRRMEAGNDNKTQMDQVEQAIAMDPDLVILNPVDANGVVPMLKRLYEAGVPTIVGTGAQNPRRAAAFAAHGGNSIRNWTTGDEPQNILELLDKAQASGVTVISGLLSAS